MKALFVEGFKKGFVIGVVLITASAVVTIASMPGRYIEAMAEIKLAKKEKAELLETKKEEEKTYTN